MLAKIVEKKAGLNGPQGVKDEKKYFQYCLVILMGGCLVPVIYLLYFVKLFIFVDDVWNKYWQEGEFWDPR